MTRPAVIVSNDLFNHGPSGLATIVPITTTLRPMRMRIRIDPPEGGLTEPSDILVDQVRTISRERLMGSPLGRVSPTTMGGMEDRLRILIEL
jgi:mRNA interferase MazF